MSSFLLSLIKSKTPSARRGFVLECGRLNIEVDDIQRIVLDELLAGLDHVTHQGRKSLVGFVEVLDFNLEQRTGLRV